MTANEVPNGAIFRVTRNKKVFKMLDNRGSYYVTVEQSLNSLRDYYLPCDERVELLKDNKC